MIINVAVQNYGGEYIYTRPVFQYSTDIALSIDNVQLPNTFKVTISNSRDMGNAIEYTAKTNPFKIPEVFFYNGENVYIWFETDSFQVLVVIPVIRKASPTKAPEGGGGGGGQTYEYDEENESIDIIPSVSGIE